MLQVKFISIYTETDFRGNTRIQENRFEAIGSYKEVSDFTFNLMNRVELPGVKPILQPILTNKYLSRNNR